MIACLAHPSLAVVALLYFPDDDLRYYDRKWYLMPYDSIVSTCPVCLVFLLRDNKIPETDRGRGRRIERGEERSRAVREKYSEGKVDAPRGREDHHDD